MRFMDVRDVEILGTRCVVTRSGYTGEDGFEISLPNDDAARVAEALLEDPAVAPIGLGARNSLRLEAGLCLYGADLDERTTPIEAGLDWTIAAPRRRGGIRAGGFPGADIILMQMADGAKRNRVGLVPEGRAPVRAGAQIFETDAASAAIGRVTSGGFGPTLNRPVAIGYLDAKFAHPGAVVFGEVRGQRLPMTVVDLPFVASKFKRG